MRTWIYTVLIMMIGLLAPFVEASFRDVGSGTPLEAAAQFLEIRGGLERRTHLLPEVEATKVAYLKMLLSPITLSEFDQARVENIHVQFTDIEPYGWYIPYLKKAVFLGVIDNKPIAFRPNDTIQRGDALDFLMDAYGLPQAYLNTNIERTFVDIFPGSKYKAVVARAQKLRLLEPYSERIFGVFHPMNRAEVILLIQKGHQVQQSLSGALRGETTEPTVITIDTSTVDSFKGWDADLYKLVLEQIEEQYLFADDIDYDALAYGAVQGMVRALGDPYTEFLPPVEAESFEVSLGSQVEGIGTYVQGVEQGLRIDAIIPGTPAEAAGLKVGDIMISANGESLKGMSSAKAASKIRGPKGTSVTIELLREGVQLTFEVIRDAFEVTSIEYIDKSGEYVLRIADFRDSTGAEFGTYVEDILAKRPDRLILDLRDNGGGYLTSSVQVLRYFAKEGDVLLQLDYGKQGEVEYTADQDGVLSDIPLVILVNANTASAAEILAGTLQDLDRAILVGETTYGKGTVQGIIDFTDNSSLKLTVGRWLTGGGRWVNEWENVLGEMKKGLEPDVLVGSEDSLVNQVELLEQLEARENIYEERLWDALEDL